MKDELLLRVLARHGRPESDLPDARAYANTQAANYLRQFSRPQLDPILMGMVLRDLHLWAASR